MTDLQTLHEAFAELERRADLVTAPNDEKPVSTGPMVGISPAPRRARAGRRLLPVVAATIAVAAVATTTALVLGRSDHHDAPAAALPSSTGSLSLSSAPVSPPPVRPRSSTSSTAIAAQVPTTPAALAARLRAVLGSTVSFTYSAPEPNSPFIVGTITNRATGKRGGFDIQIAQGSRGDKAQCEDPGSAQCHISRLTDGSSLSVGREALPTAGATLYFVNLVRPDGVTLLMHVSNQADPKGSGPKLAASPPLTTDRMVAILRSSRW